MQIKNKEKIAAFNPYQFVEFIKNISSETNFKESIEIVRNTEFPTNELKSMTVEIMQEISDKKDAELMNNVAATVQMWKKDRTKGWKSTLARFSREKQDINSVYAGKTEKGNEFVIVVDNSASDNVLAYSEFCFEVVEHHNDIADFMIVDQEEYEDMENFFWEFKKIYQRG